MKRKLFAGLLIASMFFMTSCQFIEKAVEDTFSTQPKKFNAEEEIEEKNVFDKALDLFLDESNEKVFVLDIISDAEDKMGFEFSQNLHFYMINYLREHDIERYLSEEEIIEIARQSDEKNLLLDGAKFIQIKKKLIKKLGRNDLYVYEGRVSFYTSSLHISLINPENPNYVDSYYYYADRDEWKIEPKKIKNDIIPMDNAVLLSDIPFESIDKIIETSIELLKEMGDYREFDIMNSKLGILYIYTRLYKERLVFETKVRGTREDYNLTFTIDGNLIEKERS